MNLIRLSKAVLIGTCWLCAGWSAHAQIVRSPELNVQYHRAESAWRSGGSVLEAKARVDHVLRELPDDLDARKLRAEVLLGMGHPEEALEDAQYAVRLNAADAGAQLILSEAARLSGNTGLALDALDAAAEYAPDNATFHVRLSWNAVELEQLDKAEAFARTAFELEPSEAAYQQLARVLLLRGRQEEAIEVLVRGLRASIIRPGALEQDPVLARMLSRTEISAFVNP
jgi:tetratricopeptide (TPR) repeat protein